MITRFSHHLTRRLGLACLSLAFIAPAAHALSFDDLTGSQATSGLKAALERGAGMAVSNLGVTNGFMGNDKVKIPLPDGLNQAESIMRMMGMGKQADELVAGMNSAAEMAVANAKPMLLNAVKQMSVADAKQILSGGETSVTDFFKSKTSEPLQAQFLPIVKQATSKIGLAQQYNALAGMAVGAGLMSASNATVEQYVTSKALDGLYLMIAEEEKKIRQDPVGTGVKAISTVFSTLR